MASVNIFFTQSNTDVEAVNGWFALGANGKARVEYEPPNDFLLVSDGEWLIFHEPHSFQTTHFPIDSGPFRVLLNPASIFDEESELYLISIQEDDEKTYLKLSMEENEFKCGLLFTADPYSKVLNNDDKKTATLFGDGATVTLLDDKPAFECGKFVFGSDGCKKEGIIVKEDGQLYMNGRAVFTFTVRVVPDNIRDMLKKNSFPLENVDSFILHQGSLHIVNSIADSLGVSRERCPFHSAEYGNTVSSSVPMVLSREFDKQEIKVAVLSGFGVGLSWASTMLFRKYS